MYAVETYAKVRKLVFLDGISRREVARQLGLSRDTVTKMCRFSERLDTGEQSRQFGRSLGLLSV